MTLISRSVLLSCLPLRLQRFPLVLLLVAATSRNPGVSDIRRPYLAFFFSEEGMGTMAIR